MHGSNRLVRSAFQNGISLVRERSSVLSYSFYSIFGGEQ